MKTLLLDATWRPVKFVRENRAIVLLCKDKVDLIAAWGDEKFSSPSQQFSSPAIVRLKKHVSKQPIVSPRFKRNVLYNRDNWTCQYCGTKLTFSNITIDHVVPRCMKGPTSWANCVAACKPCNRKKGGKSLRDSGLFLRTVPKDPRPQHYWNFQSDARWHPEWSNFISKDHEK